MSFSSQFVDSRKSSSDSIFSQKSQTTSTPNSTGKSSKTSPITTTLHTSIANSNTTHESSQSTTQIWTANSNPDSTMISQKEETNMFAAFSVGESSMGHHQPPLFNDTELAQQEELSPFELQVYHQLVEANESNEHYYPEPVEYASDNIYEYEDHQLHEGDSSPYMEYQQAPPRMVESGTIFMYQPHDSAEDIEVGRIFLNSAAYAFAEYNHRLVRNTVFSEWNRNIGSNPPNFFSSATSSTAASTAASPGTNNQQRTGDDLLWKPLSIYSAYTNVKVSPNMLLDIPYNSCFGKINMRCKRAWVRSPNKIRKKRRQS